MTPHAFNTVGMNGSAKGRNEFPGMTDGVVDSSGVDITVSAPFIRKYKGIRGNSRFHKAVYLDHPSPLKQRSEPDLFVLPAFASTNPHSAEGGLIQFSQSFQGFSLSRRKKLSCFT